MMIFALAGAIELEQKTASAESLLLHRSMKLKIEEMTQDGNIAIVKTRPVVDSFGIFNKTHAELTFTMKYDLEHPAMTEWFTDHGYNDMSHISKFDYLKIRGLGRKLWKHFRSDARVELSVIKREMDLTNYDDVNRLRWFYYGRQTRYRNMLQDVKHFPMEIKYDKREYERNIEEEEKFKELAHKLLNEMSSDDDSRAGDDDSQ